MKIGIMGGTFDPIHNGHLMLGRYAKELFTLDEVWYMPNGNPPHKMNEDIESQTKHRVEMVRKAIENEPSFVLQLYEVNRKEVNYSYLTMEHFQAVYPEHEFYFIIGADSLFELEKWAHTERLLKTCVILAAYRDGKKKNEMDEQIQYLNEKYEADIRLLNTPDVDISSSDIRDMLRDGKPVDEMIPEAVYRYIQEHDLYQSKLAYVKKKLHTQQGNARYEHTIGVMNVAVELAKQYDMDVDKAMLAGLLHDCAKPFTGEEKLQMCKNYGIDVSAVERANPSLLHAKLGAYLARAEYGITDQEILDAIAYHTTGRPNMTLLDKIIYIADYMEPNRNQAPNLEHIRKLAFVDLDECLYTILGSTLQYLQTKSQVIDPTTEKTYIYYKQLLGK